MNEVRSALVAIVGERHVATDPDVLTSRSIDWTGRFRGRAGALVRPGSTAEVAEVVGLCRERGLALVPQGGNTGLVGGGVPYDGAIVLDLGRMSDLGPVARDAGQVTVGAGATLAQVRQHAVEAGWRYGIDLAARDTATIGGTVATNAGGLRVIRFGMTRRQVVGIEAVLGTGEVISRLGGLVKDNTGYDLAGLLCGSEGTLGVVTQVRLALVPAPAETVTAQVGCASVDAAVALVGRLRREVPTLEAAELVLEPGIRAVTDHLGVPPVLDPIPPVILLVEAVGPPDPAAALAAVLGDADGVLRVAVATDATRAARLWQVREAQTEVLARLGVPRKYDVTVPLDRLARFVGEVPASVAAVDPGATTWLFGHVGDGNIHVNVTGASESGDGDSVGDAVLTRVVADGGSISAEHGIGRAKRSWLVRGRSRAEVVAMRQIKQALDPDGILNPGVLLPDA